MLLVLIVAEVCGVDVGAEVFRICAEVFGIGVGAEVFDFSVGSDVGAEIFGIGVGAEIFGVKLMMRKTLEFWFRMT